MQRPQDTLHQLGEMFPPFKDEWVKEGAPAEDGLVDGVYYQWTHHALLRAFLHYFASNRDAFSERELRRLGDWINHAVLTNDDLENAVSTCFLEHSRQVRINRVLAPYLSRRAKDKQHA